MNFKRLNYSEPAVLRAIIAAVIALAGAIGVTVSSDLTGLAESLVIVVSLAVPLIQGYSTRQAVYSPETVAKHAAPDELA